MGEWLSGAATAAEGVGEGASTAGTVADAAGTAGSIAGSTGEAAGGWSQAANAVGPASGQYSDAVMNGITTSESAAPAIGSGTTYSAVNNYEPSMLDKFAAQYRRFDSGGNQSPTEAYDNFGNNPETYGYAYDKLKGFGGGGQGGSPSMAPLPNGRRPQQQPQEDSWNQLMRFRRRG